MTRQELLESIAATIADYRAGEILQPTSHHVERWVNQFDAAVQDTILTEMDAILKKTYISAPHMLEALQSVGQTVPLNESHFLRIQQRGNSQQYMLDRLDELLEQEHGLTTAQCGQAGASYVYLDDCLYTGNHVQTDLKAWLPSAPQGCSVKVICIGQHQFGEYKTNEALTSLFKDKKIAIEFLSVPEFRYENRAYYNENSQVLWPMEVGDDPDVLRFVATLPKPPIVRKRPPQTFNEKFELIPAEPPSPFTSWENRAILETEFLKAGVSIIARHRTHKPAMKPLGFTQLSSLGFGSLFVTHRNIANNCPLALWWGLGGWYPLLPRRTND